MTVIAYLPVSHNFNSRLLMKRKPCIIIAYSRAHMLIHSFYFCLLPGATQIHANNEKPKSARKENKNESFYLYENGMRL